MEGAKNNKFIRADESNDEIFGELLQGMDEMGFTRSISVGNNDI